MYKLGLGGGCHWCTEAVFQSRGEVAAVQQGYLRSLPPYDSWSEGVLIEFEKIEDLEKIIKVHLYTHASTSAHSRRAEYRSAIYCFDEVMKVTIEDLISTLSCFDKLSINFLVGKRNKKYITQILHFVSFKPSRESIQNYYKTRPDAPFCQRYIEPKLDAIKNI